MSAFANLKKNRTNALAGLQKQVQQSVDNQGGGGNKDPRKWRYAFDKTTKVGSATIRFLPFGGGERLPWVEWYAFNFKSAAGSYWNRSLKTVGKEDPVAEFNALQWARNQGRDQDDVKGRKRKIRYITNIVVLNDPANKDNNGKVFLWEFGPAIHEKIMKAMVPEYEDQAPVPVFDLWEGANFKLRSKEKNQYLNYDDSTFEAAGPLHQDENVMETVYNGMHDLVEFESNDNYETYDELEKRMIKVLGARYVAAVRGETFNAEAAAGAGASPFQKEDDGSQQAPAQQEKVKPQEPKLDDDPFAAQQDAGTNTASQAEDNKADDPFASQQQDAGAEDDPFANLNLS